jgi:hypothetical protein
MSTRPPLLFFYLQHFGSCVIHITIARSVPVKVSHAAVIDLFIF